MLSHRSLPSTHSSLDSLARTDSFLNRLKHKTEQTQPEQTEQTSRMNNVLPETLASFFEKSTNFLCSLPNSRRDTTIRRRRDLQQQFVTPRPTIRKIHGPRPPRSYPSPVPLHLRPISSTTPPSSMTQGAKRFILVQRIIPPRSTQHVRPRPREVCSTPAVEARAPPRRST